MIFPWGRVHDFLIGDDLDSSLDLRAISGDLAMGEGVTVRQAFWRLCWKKKMRTGGVSWCLKGFSLQSMRLCAL